MSRQGGIHYANSLFATSYPEFHIQSAHYSQYGLHSGGFPAGRLFALSRLSRVPTPSGCGFQGMFLSRSWRTTAVFARARPV